MTQLEMGLHALPEIARYFDLVLEAARSEGVREVEAMFGASANALTRFANNTIHQNVAERGGHISVRALIDGRTARAHANRFDRESIRRVTQEAIALTRLQARDPDLLPLAGPRPAANVERFFASTAAVTPAGRAAAVRDAIAILESASLTAAGIYSTNQSALAILNSNGVSDYYCETMAQFSITAIAADSSGWSKQTACDVSDLDTPALARRAAQKAAGSAHPRQLEPGRYTVILEPAAVLDLVGQMFGDFSGTALDDGRSFLPAAPVISSSATTSASRTMSVIRRNRARLSMAKACPGSGWHWWIAARCNSWRIAGRPRARPESSRQDTVFRCRTKQAKRPPTSSLPAAIPALTG